MITLQWETVQACPLCGDDNASYYGQGYMPIIQRPDVMGGCPMATITSYVICNTCGLIFQVGRLTEQSALDFYQSGDYRASLQRPQEELDASERRTVAKILPHVEPGAHLDIGCSRGYLLAASKAQCNKVFGVEPYREYVTEDVPTCRSLDQVRGQWDTITCIHVLEHVIDPVKYARMIIALMKPGGRLVLEVPSEQSPGGPLRLAHYYLFRPPVIVRLFAGLKLVKFEMNPHNFFIFEKPI
jgi:SAM-dependent methyltransferase